MDALSLEKLTLACNQFYLAKYLDREQITDKEFDSLRKEFESEGGNIKSLIEWGDIELEHTYFEGLSKTAVEGNLGAAGLEYLAKHKIHLYYATLKYDGSSIRAYYKNGRLQKILGSPDMETGIVRTKAFWNIFPSKLEDKTIESIVGEVLADPKVYGELARNKANGLTNSKNMDDEVESEAFVRIYRTTFVDSQAYDYERQLKALMNLPKIERTRTRRTNQSGDYSEFNDVVFSTAFMFQLDEFNPESAIVDLPNGESWQCDGIVIYSPVGIQGLKFYYTDFKIVTITDIDWNRQENGSFAPVLRFDEVVINDKYCSACNAGGAPNLFYYKMGIGARVKIIMANMTIPKPIEVLKESENYNLPKCECGHQLTQDDVFGLTLKCTNHEVCDWKFKHWFGWMAQEFSWKNEKPVSPEDTFRNDPQWFFNYLYLDRVTLINKFNSETLQLSEVIEQMIDSIKEGDSDKFLQLIKNNFYLTWLQDSILEINYESSFAAFEKFFKDFDKINEEYVQSLNL